MVKGWVCSRLSKHHFYPAEGEMRVRKIIRVLKTIGVIIIYLFNLWIEGRRSQKDQGA